MKNFDKQDAYKNLERVNFWIGNSDTKTSFLLAFIGIIVGFSISNSKFIDSIIIAIKEINEQFCSFDFDVKFSLSITLILGVIIFILFLGLTLVNLLSVITSRVNPTEDELSKKRVISNSNLFFGTIAVNKGEYASIPENNFEEYLERINNLAEENLYDDINSQVYINSMICKKKFSFYLKGIKWLKRAAILAIIIIPVFLFLSSL